MTSTNLKLFVLVVILLVNHSTIVQSEGNDDSKVINEDEGRQTSSILKLPKVIDFMRFKATFHKSYKTLSEELYRMKLFLWRSYEAFMSYVDYLHHRRSYYKSINSRSDWTTDELDASRNRFAHSRKQPVDRDSFEKSSFESNSADVNIDLERGKVRKKRSLTDSPNANANQDEKKKVSKWRLISLARRAAKFDVSRTYDHLPVKSNHKLIKDGQIISGQNVAEPTDKEVWVDHRQSGCFGPVQDQGNICASCYAMATIAFFEWTHCKQTGQLTKFSEQFMVDCGPSTDNELKGCFGGDVLSAGDFVANFGIELASDYPYTGLKRECFFKSVPKSDRFGSKRVDLSNVAEIGIQYIELKLAQTPMVITMHESNNMDFYGGGVYDGKDCKPEENHVVVLVGHGREDGEEYWLLRNSRGPSWGEEGYMKLNKNSDCIHPRKGFVFRSHFKWDTNLGLRDNDRIHAYK